MKKAAAASTPEGIVVPPLSIAELEITLVGDSTLVMHQWSEKAKAEMRAKQMKKFVPKKEAKDPEAEYRAALYSDEAGQPCFPAIAFKAAAVSACSQVAGVTKVSARAAFHIDCEYVPIFGDHNMREDMVRIGMGTADLRYRPEFKRWYTTFKIKYNTGVISPEQLVNLFEMAGFGIGIGEHRPEKDGSWGRFHVLKDGEELPKFEA